MTLGSSFFGCSCGMVFGRLFGAHTPSVQLVSMKKCEFFDWQIFDSEFKEILKEIWLNVEELLSGRRVPSWHLPYFVIFYDLIADFKDPRYWTTHPEI
jgi:hypothetical protein